MYDDAINNLLKGVADGSISVKDARNALEGVELTEAQMDEAINHGVHNVAESGTIVSASLAPSGSSYLTMFFFAWGIFWACYWAFSLIYGLANDWDQQQLAFHLAMTLTTLIMMGVIYLKYILPDTIIVKHSQNKYVPEHAKRLEGVQVVKSMAKDYNLFVPEAKEGLASVGETVINRRQFLRYGFNTAAGVLTASLGVLGFAAILLPPGRFCR